MGESKVYLIRKGHHRANLRRSFKLCRYRKNQDSFVFSEVFEFDPSCIYNFGDEDDGDANKLFGITLGWYPSIKNWKLYPPHHINSLRFGWKCDCETQKITIWEYFYFNYNRYPSRYITTIDLNKKYKFELKIHRNGGILFTVYERGPVQGGDDWIIKQSTSKVRSKGLWIRKFGWKLFPYFGGNRSAPHNMIIIWHH